MVVNKQMGRLLLLILCTSLFSACSFQEKDKQSYYNSALEFIEKDNGEAAIVELRSAIQLDQKYGEARYQLGLLYLKKGLANEAFDELVRAADLLPDNLDASLKVAFIYFLSNKKEECRKRLNHIFTKDPNYREALALLAQLELKEGNYDQALTALKQLGGELDTSAELLGLKGRIHVAQKKWDDAEAAFKAAIALDGDNFASSKALLLFYETRGDKNKVKEFLAQIAQKFPDNVDAHLLQADYYRSAGEIGKVGEELEKVVAIEPENPRFRLYLADYFQKNSKKDEAEEVLVKARADTNNNQDITAALASLYFERAKYDEAKSLLEELQKDNPGHGGGKLLQARFLLKEGKIQEAQTLLLGLNKDFPYFADAYFYLGMAHYSLGETELAQQAVATAIQKNEKNPLFHVFMAELFLAKGEYEDAKREAVTALRLNNRNVGGALLLGRALIGTKQYDQAVKIFTDMRKQIPGNTEVLSNLALASLGAKDRQKGEEYLSELLEIDPGHISSIALLLGLKYKGDLPGAEAFVRQQIDKAPKEHRLYLVLGEVLEKQKKYEQALVAYDKVQELSPDNNQAMLATAKLLTQMGKNKDAMAKYNAMVEKDPKSITGKMGIAALLFVEGNYDKATDQYENILQSKEGDPLAANNLAWLIASDPDGDLGKALMLAMTAKNALPNDPSVADTLGWVHYQRGSYGLAMSQFELALQNRPDDPVFAYHLALAQSGKGQIEDAEQNLDKMLARGVEFDDREKAEELLKELQKKQKNQ